MSEINPVAQPRFSLLGLFFPPKAQGKLENAHGILLMHAIREGHIPTVPPDHPEDGIGRVWEWSNGRWNLLHRSEKFVRIHE